MELYLQFGDKMMSLCIDLLGRWGGGTVILSPRDLKPDRLRRFATQVVSEGGTTLLDPQLYNPRADHKTLQQYDFFPKAYSTDLMADEISIRQWLEALARLNNDALVSAHIVPGLYGSQVNDDWLDYHDRINAVATSVLIDRPRLATICVSGDSLRDEEQVEHILAAAKQWDVDGYYLVAEHPSARYLVDHPVWLANLLMLCSGLKLHSRKLIVGYSNQQMLYLAAAHVDAIASGTWLNVRSFSTSKFSQRAESDVSRRSTWYYCPQALSEYQVTFLDFAAQRGILEFLMADEHLVPDYAGMLFSGALPSSTAYDEGRSFRHYLSCLRAQSLAAQRGSFRETLDMQFMLLETAEQHLT